MVLLARSRGAFFSGIRRDLDLFIRLFQKCSVIDLAIVSLLAGVCEKMVFRGLLQTWLMSLVSPHVAVLAAAVVFGVTHAISRWYAMFVSVLGLVLGYVYYCTGDLPGAMVAHAVYDFGALCYGTRILGVREE